MSKKGSMELSVNSIVILVIAIVMLGLILGFLKMQFGKVSNQISGQASQEPDPTPATSTQHITLSRSTIVASAGDSTELKVGYYNAMASSTGSYTGSPSIGCGTDTVLSTSGTKFQSKIVGNGNSTIYLGVLHIASSIQPNTYLCNVTVNGESADLIIQIQ